MKKMELNSTGKLARIECNTRPHSTSRGDKGEGFLQAGKAVEDDEAAVEEEEDGGEEEAAAAG